MLEIGSVIDGKYKVLNIIGKGGMSVVYLAMNEVANKQWAIKEVSKDGVQNFDVVRQSLIAEIDMLKRMKHTNLPSIVDVIEKDNIFLIVMDYIEGNPLSYTIMESGAQPQEYVLEWAKQLCDVLDYLHTAKPPIIYRDLKPSNIMLKPNGNISLIDFGTAREYKVDAVEDTTCLGTRGYAAPEQFGGVGQSDTRTDIYCLGATLYHLITGKSPCMEPYEMYPIRQINPSLSPGLERIILKCIQNNPADRYQSCSEVLYALERYNEIDDDYKKREKKKLIWFAVCAFSSLAFALVSMSGYMLLKKKTTASYNHVIDLAIKETQENAIAEWYLDAIAINPSREEAYLGLLGVYTMDTNFSLEEEQQIELLRIHKMEGRDQASIEYLKDNAKGYAEFCYEIGKAYWYYYEEEESRVTFAAEWFADAMVGEELDTLSSKRAQLFSNIGSFHKNIKRLQEEGEDAGQYLTYWTALMELKQVDEQEKDRDAISLRLYEEVVTSIYNYIAELKEDGIAYQDILQVLNDVEANVESISSNQEKINAKRETIIALVNSTRDIVNIAYQIE